MRQGFRDYRNLRNGSPWIALKSTVGIVVLTLLAMPSPVRAQSSECLISVHQECDEELKPREVNRFGVPDMGIGFEAEATSPVAADGIGPTTRSADLFHDPEHLPRSIALQLDPAADGDKPSESAKPMSVVSVRNSELVDFNRDVYYRNRLEFSLDGGWLPINIPFVFDVFLGDAYTTTSLRYTLVPIIASIRWQVNDVGGPWIFRGNWDVEASGAVTLIPRGPETRYFAWIMGFRRNFVPRRGRIAPYFDGRVGLGGIDAKGPLGVLYAQGQNFTFTMNMGSGVRYNFNPRYSISAGLNWMHISNLYLSQPKFANYGINVYGPMFGIDVRIGRPHHRTSE